MTTDIKATEFLNHAAALQLVALPIKQRDGRLWVAVPNPLDCNIINDLQTLTGLFIEPIQAREQEIRFHIDQVYGTANIETIASQFLVEENIRKNQYQLDSTLREQLQSAPTVKLVDSLIESAILNRASDIHIEPSEHVLRIRIRLDGQLSNPQTVDTDLLPNVISRLKIMGGMNIAEKRLPQDGSFSLRYHGEQIDFRLSTLPTLYGEKAVLRLLYGQSERLSTDNLGFFPEDQETLRRMFRSPYGAVIITGPTGSGKSTTLTGFLSELNTPNVNIMTVEDPIENPIEGINHTAADPKSGFGFPRALRSILRQDPDIIMVGEIRDKETAAIAAQAAITGHLVLSTLHTNDAAGVFPRLVDMGVEPFLAAACLNGIVAQRLVRKLCENCAEDGKLTAEEARLLELPQDTAVKVPNGCGQCRGMGYSGRFAIYEYIEVNEGMRREMAGCGYVFGEVEKIMRRGSGRSMLDNGVRNVVLGRTSAAEVVRAVFRE